MQKKMETIFRLDDIEYTVVKHPRRRRASIVVSNDNTVSVRIPRYYSVKSAHALVVEHCEWIRKKRAQNREKLRSVDARRYEDGEFIPYLGSMFALRSVEQALPFVSLYEQKIIIHYPSNGNGTDRRGLIAGLLTEWYKKRAWEIVPERVKFYAPLLGVKPQGVKIKSTRSIWGSCTGKGILNFNWKVILAPLHIVDYLVVHELCHLVHRNHSRKYWNLVGTIIPDYKGRDAWLRKNGGTLTV